MLILSMTLVVFQPAWAATFSSLPAAPTEEQSAQGTGEINEETTEHLINSLAGRNIKSLGKTKIIKVMILPLASGILLIGPIIYGPILMNLVLK